MIVLRLLVAASLALLAVAPLAAAGPDLPPCTCDPSILDCIVLDDGSGTSEPPSSCPTAPTVDPKDLPEPSLGDLDPRNWPCTCDPGPQLL